MAQNDWADVRINMNLAQFSTFLLINNKLTFNVPIYCYEITVNVGMFPEVSGSDCGV